jgi:hypothetical protein
MMHQIIEKFIKNKTPVRINDKTKKCVIKEIDELGILVEYYKYNAVDLVYYTLHNITKIKPVPED